MDRLRLSIHQTNALIGMESKDSSISMRSPHGELSIEQPKAKMDIQSPKGELVIDSSKALDALAMGPHLRFMNNIYSQSPNVLQQAISKIVEDGNRMIQITNPRNAFADNAADVFTRKNPIEYATPASCLNVEVQYYPQKPIVHIEQQRPIINYTPHMPEIQYNPGFLNIYLQQKNSIQFSVSKYNMYA
ncbi:hypothetical protein E0485_12740 [Paenibacillus albiflavus]|uniref:Uncharacterized protein n=1 Tax=Paenibacillus albiflavus TaxID=2545760 RepID=A0A4R4ECG1_9BACL|nr:DUF6470 family protein [Paenibacillus albiflavus]TCZ76843.1 hypothetical protein E0485_12740 [Paenibacillus albiflavus]